MEFSLNDKVKFSPQYINKTWPTKESRRGKKRIINTIWTIIRMTRHANEDYTDWEYIITIESTDKNGIAINFTCHPEDIIKV